MPYPQWLAGERVTAADPNALAPAAVKTADEVVNNSNVPQNHDELFAPLQANATHSFESFIRYNTNDTADLRLTFTAPAGAIGTWAPFGIAAAVTADNGAIRVPGTALGAVRVLGGGRDMCAWPMGTVVTGGTAGYLRLQFAQEVATAVDTKVLQRSWLRAILIA